MFSFEWWTVFHSTIMRQEEEKILSKDCSPAWQQRSPLTMKSSPWFLHLCQASTVSALDFEAGQAAANLRRRSPFGNQSQPGYRRHWCSTMLRIDISSLKHSSLSLYYSQSIHLLLLLHLLLPLNIFFAILKRGINLKRKITIIIALVLSQSLKSIYSPFWN